MKILHISTSDKGGAATACLRIHSALLKQGIDSKVLVLLKAGDTNEVYQFNYWEGTRNILHSLYKRIKLYRYKKKVAKRYRNLPPNRVQFSFPDTVYDITQHPFYREADLVQLNWVAGFLDEASFFTQNKKPLVWRMSDLYICGGGNHYEKNFSFANFKPFLEKNLLLRKKALESANLNIVAISNWCKNKALESNLTSKFPIKIINNGVDLESYKPLDKKFCRELWNIPTDKTVILLGASYISDPRKGVELVLEALEDISTDNLYLCAFGKEQSSNTEIHPLGIVNGDKELATLYSAADYFIMSSIEEAFGQVTIEAIACGTPVISFPNGGSCDIIKEEINGVLAEDFTSQALSKAIKKALSIQFDRNVVRKNAVDEFDINDKAREYIELYKKILNR